MTIAAMAIQSKALPAVAGHHPRPFVVGGFLQQVADFLQQDFLARGRGQRLRAGSLPAAGGR